MKRLCVLVWFWTCTTFAAVPAFEIDAVPVVDLVRLVYVQALPGQAYTVAPEVLQDKRPVSLRYAPKDGDFRAFLGVFLRSLGYVVDRRAGADLIRPIGAEVKLSAVEDPSLEVFLYRPQYRDGSYLIEMLSPLFTGKFTNQRKLGIDAPKSPAVSGSGAGSMPSHSSAAAPAGSLLDQTSRRNDQVIFVGIPREVVALRKLLAQVDVDPGQVLVTGVLYEVSSSRHEGSAMDLAASLLKGQLQLHLGIAAAADNFLTFRNSSVQVIMQALDTDSRFKVLSSPSLRVASGKTASLTVGQEVPVLGAVTFPQGGSTPVQSVEYRSSGVLFSISPELRDGSISVQVDQQVSNFVATTTGVNNSPTLTKRQVGTSVNLSDGEVVVIGGLREDKDSGAASGLGFLPSWLGSRSSDRSQSEILLFLQLKRI